MSQVYYTDCMTICCVFSLTHLYMRLKVISGWIVGWTDGWCPHKGLFLDFMSSAYKVIFMWVLKYF